MKLSRREKAFLLRRRIGHLATASKAAVPAVVPVCFAIGTDRLYTAIDDKPKNTRNLRRMENLRTNPRVCFVADVYDEDWSRLAWVMIHGHAGIFESGETFNVGCKLLRRRYVQYRKMTLSPLIAVRIVDVRAWGDLDG